MQRRPEPQGAECHLSATPERYFDVRGTKELLEYFGGVVFRFTLRDAVTTINPETGETYLTPYDYFLKFVPLERDEVEAYLELVSRIRKLSRGNVNEDDTDDELEEIIEQLRFKKAKIVKAARSKLCALKELVEEIGVKNLRHTLVYCDERLLEDVVRFFQEREVIVHRFTMQEKTLPEGKYGGLSEREFLLREFAEGKYQVLAAIKCLDEGVDIPPARRAILMSSSGNPREFIQRIGRVLRRYPGKTKVQVYDMVTYIPSRFIPPGFWWVEKKLLDWEFQRCLMIAQWADNGYEAKKRIFSAWEEIVKYSSGGERL
ncbi:MAG: helicase-related protein [Atribacterota bacterium]